MSVGSVSVIFQGSVFGFGASERGGKSWVHQEWKMTKSDEREKETVSTHHKQRPPWLVNESNPA
jgi:hypothetical protein